MVPGESWTSIWSVSLFKNLLSANNIFLSEPDETVFRVLGEILKEVSGKYYPPRGKDLVNLMKKTQNKNFTKATLGGCIIERVHDSLLIKKDLKK